MSCGRDREAVEHPPRAAASQAADEISQSFRIDQSGNALEQGQVPGAVACREHRFSSTQSQDAHQRPPETFPELRRSHSCTPDLPKAELCAIVIGVVTKLCAAPTSPTALILNLFCNSNKSKLSFPERSRATQSCMQLQSSVLISGKELLSRARSFLFLSNFSQSEPEPHYWTCGKGSKGGLACSIKGGRRGWK